MTTEVRDNADRQRFEMTIGDVIAFIEYRREGNRIVLLHTEVPVALSGQGVGLKLVSGVLDRLRADGVDLVSECRFVTAYVKHHPEYRNFVVERG